MIRVEDGGWSVNRTALTDAEFAARTGILVKPVVPKEVKKRGRPKGSKDTHPRKRRKSDDGAEASLS